MYASMHRAYSLSCEMCIIHKTLKENPKLSLVINKTDWKHMHQTSTMHYIFSDTNKTLVLSSIFVIFLSRQAFALPLTILLTAA